MSENTNFDPNTQFRRPEAGNISVGVRPEENAEQPIDNSSSLFSNNASVARPRFTSGPLGDPAEPVVPDLSTPNNGVGESDVDSADEGQFYARPSFAIDSSAESIKQVEHKGLSRFLGRGKDSVSPDDRKRYDAMDEFMAREKEKGGNVSNASPKPETSPVQHQRTVAEIDKLRADLDKLFAGEENDPRYPEAVKELEADRQKAVKRERPGLLKRILRGNRQKSFAIDYSADTGRNTHQGQNFGTEKNPEPPIERVYFAEQDIRKTINEVEAYYPDKNDEKYILAKAALEEELHEISVRRGETRSAVYATLDSLRTEYSHKGGEMKTGKKILDAVQPIGIGLGAKFGGRFALEHGAQFLDIAGGIPIPAIAAITSAGAKIATESVLRTQGKNSFDLLTRYSNLESGDIRRFGVVGRAAIKVGKVYARGAEKVVLNKVFDTDGDRSTRALLSGYDSDGKFFIDKISGDQNKAIEDAAWFLLQCDVLKDLGLSMSDKKDKVIQTRYARVEDALAETIAAIVPADKRTEYFDKITKRLEAQEKTQWKKGVTAVAAVSGAKAAAFSMVGVGVFHRLPGMIGDLKDHFGSHHAPEGLSGIKPSASSVSTVSSENIPPVSPATSSVSEATVTLTPQPAISIAIPDHGVPSAPVSSTEPAAISSPITEPVSVTAPTSTELPSSFPGVNPDDHPIAVAAPGTIVPVPNPEEIPSVPMPEVESTQSIVVDSGKNAIRALTEHHTNLDLTSDTAWQNIGIVNENNKEMWMHSHGIVKNILANPRAYSSDLIRAAQLDDEKFTLLGFDPETGTFAHPELFKTMSGEQIRQLFHYILAGDKITVSKDWFPDGELPNVA